MPACLKKPDHNSADLEYNFAYYPVLFETEEALLKAVEMLNANLIFPRRYFYPSLNKLKYITINSCPIAEEMSTKVLCLPLYFNLSMEEIDLVCRLLLRVQNN